MRFSTALAQGLLASSVSAIATIEIKGNKFFKSTGEQFYLKGKRGGRILALDRTSGALSRFLGFN